MTLSLSPVGSAQRLGGAPRRGRDDARDRDAERDDTRDARWRIAALGAVVAAVVVAHHGIFAIPFTYSEVSGIEKNPVVVSPARFFAQMSTPRALLQRPLSVASYMLDYRLHGDDPRGFHATNLVLHCVNTALVFVLAPAFGAPAPVSALVFGLHPLATACVGQIFGRNYSLATTF